MYIHIGINIDTYANSLSHTHTHTNAHAHTQVLEEEAAERLDLKDFAVRVDHKVKFRFFFSL
jgi:hypothetical protein